MNVGKLVRLNRSFQPSVRSIVFGRGGSFYRLRTRVAVRPAANSGDLGGNCGRPAGRRDDAQGNRRLGLGAPCGPGAADCAEHGRPSGRLGL